MKDYEGIISESKKIADNVHMLSFDIGEEVKARCGQFVNLSTGGMRLLRRPIAICKAEGSEITVCFQIKGEGTKALANSKAGRQNIRAFALRQRFFRERRGEENRACRRRSRDISHDFRNTRIL